MGVFLLLLIIFIIYLWLVMPCFDRRAEVQEFLNVFYAHRGLHDNKKGIPENSLAAFQEAIKFGYGIELDVLLTKDNVPVVVHDNNLKRLCGVNKKVSNSTYEEIFGLRLLDTNQHIPKLVDVLELVNNKVILLVELKTSVDIKRNCSQIADVLDSYSGRYCVCSFNPFMMKWFRKNRNEVIRGQIATDFFKSKSKRNFISKCFSSFLLLNFISRPDYISYNIKYKDNLALRINKTLLNTPLFGWTIRTQGELDNVKNFFDSYIFENFLPKETDRKK